MAPDAFDRQTFKVGKKEKILRPPCLDILARGLLNAARMIEGKALSSFVDERYKGWTEGLGKDILEGRADFDALAETVAKDNINPKPRSGRQEMLENIVNRYV